MTGEGALLQRGSSRVRRLTLGHAVCPLPFGGDGNVVEVQEYDTYAKTTFYSGGSAFGVSQVGNRFGWKGAPVDHETGLVYMRNRYYNPKDGRFESRDPLGVGGDLVTWMNVYNYGSASPYVQHDPYGLQVIQQQIQNGTVAPPRYAAQQTASSIPDRKMADVRQICLTRSGLGVAR